MRKRIRMLGIVAFSLFAAILVTGCLATQPSGNDNVAGTELPTYGVITTQQAANVVNELRDNPSFVLLDIRTPLEVEAGHISGAVALDFYSDSFRDDLASLDRDLVYLIYCRTGNRTGQAYRIMDELGFEKVYDMGGGISQWLAAGYPVCLGSLHEEHTCSGDFPTL